MVSLCDFLPAPFFSDWIFVEADGDPTLPATWPSGG